jgi:anti-sigma B factor antagonist
MAPDRAFSVTVETDGAVRVLRLAGDLDLATAPAFRQQFRQPIAESAVTIDMTDVTFVDSTGIGALLAVRRRGIDAGWSLTLRGVHPKVTRVLAITGVDTILTIEK